MLGLMGMAQVLAAVAYGIKGVRRGQTTWQWPKFCLDPDFFFWTAPSAFRLVTNFEAYLRTSGESNHHRKSVRVVERHRPTVPTSPQGRLSFALTRKEKTAVRWLDGLSTLPPTGTSHHWRLPTNTETERLTNSKDSDIGCAGKVLYLGGTLIGRQKCLVFWVPKLDPV